MHRLRHSTVGTGPPATYNSRLLARTIPFSRGTIIAQIKKRLEPSLSNLTTSTSEDGNTVVQCGSALDKIHVSALESIDDEMQIAMLGVAGNVTDILLSRILVDVAAYVSRYY